MMSLISIALIAASASSALATSVPQSQVNCGSHRQSYCGQCPWNTDFSKYHGKSWCNGDCKWDTQASFCVAKSTPTCEASYTQTQCYAAGGNYQQVNLLGQYKCNCRTGDYAKPCMSNSQCEGYCTCQQGSTTAYCSYYKISVGQCQQLSE
eukprot:Pgem_evm1s8073